VFRRRCSHPTRKMPFRAICRNLDHVKGGGAGNEEPPKGSSWHIRSHARRPVLVRGRFGDTPFRIAILDQTTWKVEGMGGNLACRVARRAHRATSAEQRQAASRRPRTVIAFDGGVSPSLGPCSKSTAAAITIGYARKGGGEARHASDFGLCTSGWMQLAM
jgi:hypothetical protein